MNMSNMINVFSATKRSRWVGAAMFCSLFFTLNAFAIAGPPPVISLQPTNRTVSLGSNTTFTVAVTSSSALTYQWYFNGAKIAGATTNVYTRTNVQLTNAGPYYVAITNSGGSVNSTNAVLSVISGSPPVISLQPTNRTASLGSNTTFTVTATSSSTLAYQWYFNGVKIAGATTNVYTCANAQFTNAGPYYVAITNVAGSITSASAVLNVLPTTNRVLPAPWVSADIGTTRLTGSAYAVSNLYTVNGSGASLSGALADQFHYVYQTMPGNGSLKAKIVSQSGTNVNGYAGIMIRETTATGSAFIFAGRQGNGTVVARSRTATGGSTVSSNGPSLALANFWVELLRTNNNISALSSSNGTTWVTVQTNKFTMATNVTFGLFVTSGNTNVLDSDVFTNITAVP